MAKNKSFTTINDEEPGLIVAVDPTALSSGSSAAVAAARVALLEAEAEGQRIDNRTAIALATTAEISAERERQSAEWERVANSRFREYHFTAQVDHESVANAIDVLTRWDRIDSDAGDFRPYKFVICSPGGAVIHGMKLYSTIKALSSKRPVITVASGFCASMGTIIHQAGSLRVIEPGCSYLIHDVSGEAFGSHGSMEDTMEWMNKLNALLHKCLADKANVSVEEIKAISRRKDAWFMPEEVIQLGLADVIAYGMNATPDMPITTVFVQPAPKTRKKPATTTRKKP